MVSAFRLVFSFLLFLISVEGKAMTPNDMNSEFPADFERNMPVALVKCADYCVEGDFAQAAKCLVSFAGTYSALFHSELVSIKYDRPSESGTKELLKANYESMRDLYEKEDSPYDRSFDLKMFVRSGFLGALYWDYSCMLSDLIYQMDELKKNGLVLQVLVDTILQPKRSLLDIINSKVEIN